MWKGVLDLLEAAGKLKRIRRAGWVEVGVQEPESVAEHSYRTALLAMILADLQGLDAEKAVRMALLHDLAEAEVGDLTPEEKGAKGQAHILEEDEAMDRLLSPLPEPLSARYSSLWRELRCAASPEAEMVTQADKLEMCIQALEYKRESFDPSRLNRFLKIEGRGLPKELLKEVIERNKDRNNNKSDPDSK
ncbi:HD domain-containing protein [Candidatus Bathyarchaeota archaeon]|nr:HD domain-containing protein [Candidatus Bathyarchaeota archaeon]